MSELSSGEQGGLGQWGYPSSLYNLETGNYDNGGMVWQGGPPATKADKQQCRDYVLHSPCKLDRLSFCGKDDPAWTHWTDENRDEYPYKQSIVL